MAKAHPGTYRVSGEIPANTDAAMDKLRWKVPTLKKPRSWSTSSPIPLTGTSMFGDALMQRTPLLVNFFEPSPAIGIWHYSPEGMQKLLHFFQTLPVKGRRVLFDAFTVDWAVEGALWYHFRIDERLTEDSYWILFSTWLKRPSYLLARGNSPADDDVDRSYIRAQPEAKQRIQCYLFKSMRKSRHQWRAQTDFITFEYYCNFDLSGGMREWPP